MKIQRGLLASICVATLLAATAVAQSPPRDVAWFDVPASSVRGAVWTDGNIPFYALSLDAGATIATVKRADYTVHLRYQRFDPLVSEPMIPALLASPAGSRLYLVQYVTQGLPEYRGVLEALGAEILHFVPNYTDLVRMDDRTAAAVRDQSFVRWVGRYHPAYRIDEVMRAELLAGSAPTRRYYIHVGKKGLAEKQSCAAAIRALGGRPADYISPYGFLFTAELDASQLLMVASRDDVLFIDRWSAPEDDMDIARQLFGADYVESVAGYTGAGVRAEVMDGGLRDTHADFQSPAPPLINNGNTTDTSHGTSTYGIVFGDGASDPAARGVLPDAQGIFSSYSLMTDRWLHTQGLLQPPYEAVFQSNSWGNARTFFYTNISADMDQILFDHDIVICQSQSNAGNQDSRPQAWAKNIVSVGGIRHQNTLTTADDAWNGGASIGPADDGRIKPDLSAFYDSIRTTSSTSDTSHTTGFGGTSGATPIVAGHFGLFFQMWANGIFGNPVTGTTVFDARPHMTTAKAMMINHAGQYPFTGTTSDLTRVHQGWGRPDLQKMYDGRNRLFIVDETDVLPNLTTMAYSLTVTPADSEFRATLVYADPPGVPGAAMHRINDLTLKVTDPNNVVYWGNNGLLAGNWSTPGGSPNTIDTVENVFVQNPTPGTWTVEVIASEVNQDGHVETPAIDADYALVVSGVDPPPPPTPDTGQPNSPNARLRIAGATNVNGFAALDGVNGPFFANLTATQSLQMAFESQPGWVFITLFGPLNRNNALYSFGSLDLGLMGPGNLGDVQVVMDGFTGTGFFDLLANVGPAGAQTITLPVAGLPIGTFGAFQAAFLDPANPSVLALSAATEISIQ